jgi:hypothetical protein
MANLIPCPSCENDFNPWYSKDKGKPQKFPYKSCFSCKQKRLEEQNNQPPEFPPQQNMFEVEVINLLQRIANSLENNLPYAVLAGKKQELAKKTEIPQAFQSDEEDIDVSQIPF